MVVNPEALASLVSNGISAGISAEGYTITHNKDLEYDPKNHIYVGLALNDVDFSLKLEDFVSKYINPCIAALIELVVDCEGKELVTGPLPPVQSSRATYHYLKDSEVPIRCVLEYVPAQREALITFEAICAGSGQ